MSLTKASYSMITGSPVNIFDFIPPSEHAAITAGTSTYDCYSAIVNAIASFPDPTNNIYYSQAGTLWFPPGKYYCSTTIQVERAVYFLGSNSATAGNALSESIIEFAANQTGFSVQRYNTSVSGKGGDGARFENLSIIQKSGSTIGDGIRSRARLTIKNCSFYYWGGNGIRIVASAGGGGVSEGNANNFYIQNCVISAGQGNGVYISGADANAGNIIGVDSSNNQGWGFLDSSFLGNTYTGCHASSNTLGAYKSTDNNARNMYVGCYSESGQPPSSVVYPSMIIGGLQGAGYNSDALALEGSISGIKSNSGFVTKSISLNVGQSNTTGIQQYFTDTTGAQSWTQSRAIGRIGYQWASLGTPSYFVFYDQTATVANGYARDLSSSQGAIGISAHYFGEINQMKYRGLDSAAPTTGSWLQGDIVWNTAPTSGGYAGWICTASGTPGTWKTFGLIS